MLNKKKNKDQKEFNPYAIDKFAKISPKWKIGFLKFWVVGAAFYASIFSLPERFDYTDRIVIFWLVLVLMLEYIAFTIIRWMHNDETDTKKFLPHEISSKSTFSLFATGLYVFIMMIIIHFFFTLWVGLNLPTIGSFMSETSMDPITYGLVFLLFDYIWLKIRQLIKRARTKKERLQ